MNARIRTFCARLSQAAAQLDRQICLMEVCGTHTMAIFRHGIAALLPERIRLVSGPGCPVCVTAQGLIDLAVDLACRPGLIVATYGDMVRVPGRSGSLEQARAQGARVEVVVSARDSLELARANPPHQVVFVAVGFETTAPATADTILLADRAGLDNFSVLLGHKRIVPAMQALLASDEVRIDGFLCPGHVSVVIGSQAYRPIVEQFGRGCVVAGFEPGQILLGLARLAEMAVQKQPLLENIYAVAVQAEGNRRAQDLLEQVFVPGEAVWRGLGAIPDSGLLLRPGYRRFDAEARFGLQVVNEAEPPGCRCGDVLRGLIDPVQCSLFGRACTPTRPVGPCMVSSEGTCQAWFKYRRVAV